MASGEMTEAEFKFLSKSLGLMSEFRTAGSVRFICMDWRRRFELLQIMRLFAQSHHFESGKVLLPSFALWLREFIRELTSFPGSKHDDQVDSTTQALPYMAPNTSSEIWAKLGRG